MTSGTRVGYTRKLTQRVRKTRNMKTQKQEPQMKSLKNKQTKLVSLVEIIGEIWQTMDNDEMKGRHVYYKNKSRKPC